MRDTGGNLCSLLVFFFINRFFHLIISTFVPCSLPKFHVHCDLVNLSFLYIGVLLCLLLFLKEFCNVFFFKPIIVALYSFNFATKL